MSDTSYAVYQHYGTNAQRLAFTPSPPASGQPIYVWYETDTDKVFLYTTGWHQIASSSSGSAISALTGDVTATGPGSVAATIANSAVTLAKIANASANSKLLGSGDAGSGAPYAEITLGTNLSMSGTTLNASGGGGSGSLVLLESHTASASASLNFTTCVSSTYDEYQIEFVNLVLGTDNVNFLMRMSTNGGVSYDSGANYRYNGFIVSGGTAVLGASGATSLFLNYTSGGVGIDNGGSVGFNGQIRLFNPLGTSLYKSISGQVTYLYNDNTLSTYWPTGHYVSTTAVNAFQFLASSGNIASGTIRVYGLAK